MKFPIAQFLSPCLNSFRPVCLAVVPAFRPILGIPRKEGEGYCRSSIRGNPKNLGGPSSARFAEGTPSMTCRRRLAGCCRIRTDSAATPLRASRFGNLPCPTANAIPFKWTFDAWGRASSSQSLTGKAISTELSAWRLESRALPPDCSPRRRPAPAAFTGTDSPKQAQFNLNESSDLFP
jgi:hypothetical protein